jgi:hypothetical protein
MVTPGRREVVNKLIVLAKPTGFSPLLPLQRVLQSAARLLI